VSYSSARQVGSVIYVDLLITGYLADDITTDQWCAYTCASCSLSACVYFYHTPAAHAQPAVCGSASWLRRVIFPVAGCLDRCPADCCWVLQLGGQGGDGGCGDADVEQPMMKSGRLCVIVACVRSCACACAPVCVWCVCVCEWVWVWVGGCVPVCLCACLVCACLCVGGWVGGCGCGYGWVCGRVDVCLCVFTCCYAFGQGHLHGRRV
jgi:hypothetical protein